MSQSRMAKEKKQSVAEMLDKFNAQAKKANQKNI